LSNNSTLVVLSEFSLFPLLFQTNNIVLLIINYFKIVFLSNNSTLVVLSEFSLFPSPGVPCISGPGTLDFEGPFFCPGLVDVFKCMDNRERERGGRGERGRERGRGRRRGGVRVQSGKCVVVHCCIFIIFTMFIITFIYLFAVISVQNMTVDTLRVSTIDLSLALTGVIITGNVQTSNFYITFQTLYIDGILSFLISLPYICFLLSPSTLFSSNLYSGSYSQQGGELEMRFMTEDDEPQLQVKKLTYEIKEKTRGELISGYSGNRGHQIEQGFGASNVHNGRHSIPSCPRTFRV
jgi:hypothetical protein